MLNKIWKQYVYVFLIIWYLTRTISTKYMYMMKKKLGFFLLLPTINSMDNISYFKLLTDKKFN